MYRRALASGHFFSRFTQANCLRLSRYTFPRFTATLTTHSCIICVSPNISTGQFEAVTAIQLRVDDIRNWMTNDKLLLNDDKTEFLMIGTKQQLAKVNIDHILIGDRVISSN